MARKTLNSIYSIMLLFPLLLSSCGGKAIFADTYEIKSGVWELSDVANFTFGNSDSLVTTDVEFLIRTGPDYPYRNIYLFVTSSSPDGKSMTDTLEYYLSDEKGNRYGKGTGGLFELRLPYKSNVFFPEKGNYFFSIRHGMRIMDLSDVYDIGIRITEAEKK